MRTILGRILATLLLFFVASPSYAWTDAKLNFRSTSAYVTDGVGETEVISSPEASGGNMEAYAVTRETLTFGWLTPASGGTRNRNSGVDARFAGLHFNENGNQETFELDGFTAGCTYDIHLAAGDQGNATATVYFQLFDNATQFGSTINSSTSGADRFLDATGVERTSANWDANNVAVTRVFASTVFKLKIGNNAATGTGIIAHIWAHQVSCPSASTLFKGAIGGGLGGKKMVIGD